MSSPNMTPSPGQSEINPHLVDSPLAYLLPADRASAAASAPGASTADSIDSANLPPLNPSTTANAQSAPSQNGILHDDADVQEYMNRLLQRASNVPVSPVAQSEAPAAPSIQPSTTVTMDSVDDRWEPDQLVPRSIAPETNTGLSALREVAMQSQRSAIETCARRQLQTNTWKYLATTLVPLSFGVLLFTLSRKWLDFSMIASIVCFLAMTAPLWQLWKSVRPLTKDQSSKWTWSAIRSKLFARWNRS